MADLISPLPSDTMFQLFQKLVRAQIAIGGVSDASVAPQPGDSVELTMRKYVNAIRGSSASSSGFAYSVSPSSVSVTVGLTTTLTPTGFTGSAVTYSSSNTGVATVNSSGVVTGVAAGTAVILVTGVANPAEVATTTVTAAAAVASPSVSPSSVSVNVGSTTTLTASNFTGGTVTWSSSNTAHATVNSSGVVTGVAAGTAVITATGVSNNTQTATSTVTAVAVSGYNPLTQGTLLNWYDASTLALSNAASITSWTDSASGAPNTFTESGGNQPIFLTSGINSKGTANFPVGNYMLSGGGSASTFPRTIAAVVQVSDHNAYYVLVGQGSSGTGGLVLRIESSTGNLALISGSTAVIGTSTTAVSTTGAHLVVAVVTSSTYAFYIDGTLAGSGSHSISLAASRNFLLGTEYDGSSYLHSFIGKIGEIQIYSSALNSTDLTALHTYSVSKWATP